MYIRAGSYESTTASAGEFRQSEKCKIVVNGEQICKQGSRGFNVHIVNPYGESPAYTHRAFDTFGSYHNLVDEEMTVEI